MPAKFNYSLNPHMQKRWDTVGRKLAFSAKDQTSWRSWRRALARKLKQLTGYDTMIRTPPRPRITEQKDLGDLIRQHVVIRTEPGVLMPMYVLMPKSSPGPHPVILAPHGHAGGGKAAVAGLRDDPAVADAIKVFNYDYGVQFARAGFITFCPDARGFGQRRECPETQGILESSCQWLNNMAIPLGQTVTGMWTWDLHRLVDYVRSRRDCRPDRIGCVGLSGGGLQTLWAAALDTRIRCAVISGYMYGCKESLLEMYHNCSCNYVPHLYEYADMGDIAALIAPRPLLVETGDRDSLNGAGGLKNVHSQMRIIRRAYRLARAPGNVAHDVFEGEHRWNGVRAIPWMKRFLMKD